MRHAIDARLRMLPVRLGLVLAFALIGCETTVNPATGRPELLLMSEEQEREVDQEESERVEAEIGLVDAPQLAAYVSALGERLAKHSPRIAVDYQFGVLEMDEPNAFALPGGHIYVSRGLLLLAESEAELANVIGHEIGHVAARHAAGRDAHVKTLGLSTLLGTLAGARGGPGRSGEGVGPGGSFAYGREQEREADRIGQDLAVAAGIDPSGMARFLRALDSSTRLQQGYSQTAGYFSTHPATPERIAETATSAQTRRWQPRKGIAGTRESFLAKLEGISIGRPASEGIQDEETFLHPDLGFVVRFPRNWEVENQHARVLGVSPARDAIAMLELQGVGRDPRAAAEEYSEEASVKLRDETPVRIGDFAAFRARGHAPTPLGPMDSEIVWLVYDGRIYRLTTTLGKGERYEGAARSFARSFRPISEAERGGATELRLQIGVARAGESLADFSRRMHNTWDLPTTAVMNRLFIDDPLAAGQKVKVAVRVPYEAKPVAPAPPPEEDAEPAPADESASRAPAR